MHVFSSVTDQKYQDLGLAVVSSAGSYCYRSYTLLRMGAVSSCKMFVVSHGDSVFTLRFKQEILTLFVVADVFSYSLFYLTGFRTAK